MTPEQQLDAADEIKGIWGPSHCPIETGAAEYWPPLTRQERNYC
jgi:hypothetical protein